MKVAVMTIGTLKEAADQQSALDFFERVPDVYAAAERSAGFQSRANRSWGPIVVPSCWKEHKHVGPIIATLSIWDDLESVTAYSYHGKHGAAFAKRKEWFETVDLPGYVVWWIEDEHKVEWPEAAERFESIFTNGSTAFAFNFMHPFDVSGLPTRLLGSKVRERVVANEANN